MMTSCLMSKPTTTPLCAEIQLPGDKSISHRSMMLAAIAKGTTTITGFLKGADCLATLNAFCSMGIRFEASNNFTTLTIDGLGKFGLKAPTHAIDCGNSGTSIRLLAGLLAAQSFDSCLQGDSSLHKRPMGRICKPLTQMGAKIESINNCPPLFIQGGRPLRGITYHLPEASAQVKSCVLLAGLYAKGNTSVIEPVPTRDHTEKMLSAFSYPIHRGYNEVTLSGLHELRATSIKVPGDISSAAFFIVATLIKPGSKLLIKKVGVNPTRIGFLQILKQMGASIEMINQEAYGEEEVADLIICSSTLHGIVIPEHLVPLAIDEFPILFIAAVYAKGRTLLRGAAELRLKESDRIEAMAVGLRHLGIHIQTFNDGIEIEGGILQGGEVDSFHDHRIAMAFSIAGAVAKAPILIKHCENIATSFPNFIKIAHDVQLSIQEYNE